MWQPWGGVAHLIEVAGGSREPLEPLKAPPLHPPPPCSGAATRSRRMPRSMGSTPSHMVTTSAHLYMSSMRAAMLLSSARWLTSEARCRRTKWRLVVETHTNQNRRQDGKARLGHMLCREITVQIRLKTLFYTVF